MAIKRESDAATDCVVAESTKRQRTDEQEGALSTSTLGSLPTVPNAHDNATNNDPPFDTETVQEDGDLTVRIIAKENTADEQNGGRKKVEAEFLTDSGALRRASSILKAKIDMSRPPADDPWVIEFSDGHHPQSVLIVLRVLHCQKPRQFVFNEGYLEFLYEAANFTALYNLAGSLQLIADNWSQTLHSDFKTREKKDEWYLRHVLWIAWEIGARKLFRDVIREFAMRCYIDDSGEMVFAGRAFQEILHNADMNDARCPILREKGKATVMKLYHISQC